MCLHQPSARHPLLIELKTFVYLHAVAQRQKRRLRCAVSIRRHGAGTRKHCRAVLAGVTELPCRCVSTSSFDCGLPACETSGLTVGRSCVIFCTSTAAFVDARPCARAISLAFIHACLAAGFACKANGWRWLGTQLRGLCTLHCCGYLMTMTPQIFGRVAYGTPELLSTRCPVQSGASFMSGLHTRRTSRSS